MRRTVQIELARKHADNGKAQKSPEEEKGLNLLVGFVLIGIGCFLLATGITGVVVSGDRNDVGLVFLGYVSLVAGTFVVEVDKPEPSFRWYHAAVLALIIPLLCGLAAACKARHVDARAPGYLAIELNGRSQPTLEVSMTRPLPSRELGSFDERTTV